ncbi:MAG: inner membrane CreD family protein [Candidatus Hydrogenedentes bacterium]|nr:inner membrane CreD family protein [Candidatus Hydrogenedentota bacterium]
MSAKRLAAIVLVFVAACAGWWGLGLSTARRSTEFHGRLGDAVEKLWGTPLVQSAPSVTVEIPGSDRVRPLMPVKNDVQVALNADYRKKGLIWYPTYTCSFTGSYTIANTEEVAQKMRIHFDFPAGEGTYDAFAATIDGAPLNAAIDTQAGLGEIVELGPGESAVFDVSYATRGIGEWQYRMDPGVGRVQNLNLVVTTDFCDVDYPAGCLSPMAVEDTSDGMVLTWSATDLITRENIGVIVPERLNPGPLTSRITFFAPVCLVFFFVLVATINILYKVNIHPMHYLFVAAGFFAFHLLLAYMAGHVPIHAAFAISAVVSVGLVTSYLSGALRGQFPWKVAAAGQVFFLVLFSYSFFLEGFTGLTVAIGSVVTLAVLMRVTAHIDWNEVFARPPAPAAPAPPAPAPPPLPASGTPFDSAEV